MHLPNRVVVPTAVRNYRFTIKDCKGSNPINNSQKIKGIANAIPFILWRRARDSAHFVRRKVCYANYPDYRLLLTRLRLAKDCKGSNPINNSQKITVQCYSRYTVISWRRARDFSAYCRTPSHRFAL